MVGLPQWAVSNAKNSKTNSLRMRKAGSLKRCVTQKYGNPNQLDLLDFNPDAHP